MHLDIHERIDYHHDYNRATMKHTFTAYLDNGFMGIEKLAQATDVYKEDAYKECMAKVKSLLEEWQCDRTSTSELPLRKTIISNCGQLTVRLSP